jgi:hypothetical protein
MAQDWSVHALVYFYSAGSDLPWAVLYWRLDLEFTDMTKLDALRILKLLSALESWAFSTKYTLPPFVDAELAAAMKVLEDIVLKEDK